MVLTNIARAYLQLDDSQGAPEYINPPACGARSPEPQESMAEAEPSLPSSEDVPASAANDEFPPNTAKLKTTNLLTPSAHIRAIFVGSSTPQIGGVQYFLSISSGVETEGAQCILQFKENQVVMQTVNFLAVSLASVGLIFAQGRSGQATVLIPDSSMEAAEDRGVAAHTNHLILVHPAFTGTAPAGETPASIRPVYGLPPSGGSNIIVIVDAFDYPTAENDLNVFSSTLGLPPCTTANGCFTKIFAGGSQPRANCGWGQEAALDIEWAHAMAPNAKIVLVEAATNSFANLFAAVDVASNYIAAHGGKGEVSMSWGGSEFSGEVSNDSHFTTSGIVYFASSGDTGGVTIYPGVSPNVVSAGGTTINRNGGGTFVSETGWSGSGGGRSAFEPRPGYQAGIAGIVGTQRGVPDFSFDADPNSGVSVYDSTRCQGNSGWLVFGGTSVASPSLAGIVNLAGLFSSGSQVELATIYSNLGKSADFRDILSGTAGSFSATTGWDFVTGVGSNQGTSGK
jgi:kumamolisin